jgi:hypothetical protein
MKKLLKLLFLSFFVFLKQTVNTALVSAAILLLVLEQQAKTSSNHAASLLIAPFMFSNQMASLLIASFHCHLHDDSLNPSTD